MRFGLFTRGYQNADLEQAFSDAFKYEYDYVELWGGRPHAFGPDLITGDAAYVKQLVEQYSMPVPVYTPEHNAYPYNYMQGDKRQWKDAMDYLSICLDAATAIGAEYTLISVGHAGFSSTREQRSERLIKSLDALSQRATDAGQKILLETLTPYESNTCTTLADLCHTLQQVSSPNLFAVCDVVVPFVQCEPLIEYPRQLGDKMRHIHLQDSDGASDAHLVPGDGCLPISEFLYALCDLEYSGTVTIELVTRYMSNPSLYSKRAIQRIRAMLAEQGR